MSKEKMTEDEWVGMKTWKQIVWVIYNDFVPFMYFEVENDEILNETFSKLVKQWKELDEPTNIIKAYVVISLIMVVVKYMQYKVNKFERKYPEYAL